MSLGTYKVVLLGEGRVGKTSIASRFVEDTFDSGQVSTVQANMYSKKRIPIEGTLESGKSGEKSKGRKYVDIALWDTAGQERYHALGPIYYRNANGAVLVYDITDADTFERIRMWIKELRQVVGDNIHIVICGNKSDLEKEREVNLAMAEKFAKAQGATHFSTSAKTNEGVNEAFQCLVQKILESLGLVGSGGAANAAGKGGEGGAEGEGGEDNDDAVPLARGSKRNGKKLASPTGTSSGGGRKGGVKIALDDDDGPVAASPEEDEEQFPTASSSKKSKASGSSGKSGKSKIKDDDDDDDDGTPNPYASNGFGYDDYGSYGVPSNNGVSSSSGGDRSTQQQDGAASSSSSSSKTNNNANSKAAPPTSSSKKTTNESSKADEQQRQKRPAAAESSNTKDQSPKNKPITLDDKGRSDAKKDKKKDKDCC